MDFKVELLDNTNPIYPDYYSSFQAAVLMTLSSLKQEIWHHAKVNRNVVVLQTYADKAQVRLPITQVHEAEKLLKLLNKGNKAPKQRVSDAVYKRYRDAKYAYEEINYPNWINKGHFIEPDRPECSTANGLQNFIQEHATWMGCHANRINTVGRKVGDKWITGTTKKGTADVALIISGRSVHLEIKAGKDKPSPAQLKQQQQVRAAQGVYEFIRTPEEYFAVFDRYYSKVLTIFD